VRNSVVAGVEGQKQEKLKVTRDDLSGSRQSKHHTKCTESSLHYDHNGRNEQEEYAMRLSGKSVGRNQIRTGTAQQMTLD